MPAVLRRWLWRWAVPGVLDYAEMMELLAITSSDLSAIAQQCSARRRGAWRGFYTDKQGKRQWIIREALPLAAQTLRGFTH
jgi:hypothetical protein